MATCAISIPSLPRSSQRRISQVSARTKQSQRRFLLNTGNLEARNSEGLLEKSRIGVSFFPSFLKKKGKSREEVKEELFKAIEPLDRGAEATPEDQERIDQVILFLEIWSSVLLSNLYINATNLFFYLCCDLCTLCFLKCSDSLWTWSNKYNQGTAQIWFAKWKMGANIYYFQINFATSGHDSWTSSSSLLLLHLWNLTLLVCNNWKIFEC